MIEDEEEDLEGSSEPHNQHENADKTSDEVLRPPLNDDVVEDVHIVDRREADHEPTKEDATNFRYERPRRTAAARNRDNIKEMISTGILKMNTTSVPKPPTHGWIWTTFRDLVVDEDDIIIVRSTGDSDVSRTENSAGTYSPLVNYAPPSPSRTSTDPLHTSDMDSDQEDYVRDTPRRSLRLQGVHTNWATYDAFGRK